MTEMKDLEAIIGTLKKEATPARPNMTASTSQLYANPETGTVVLEVYTSNMSLPYTPREAISWTYYLVGNEHGYAKTWCWVSSESHFSRGPVKEDGQSVTIKRHGMETTYFGIQIPIGDIVLDKSKFTPYGSA